MSDHGIELQSWSIPNAEVQRINEASIEIQITNTSTDPVADTYRDTSRNIFIIKINTTYLDGNQITPEQQIGIILHEIGHRLNPAPYSAARVMNASEDCELYADYYAHYCGYGEHFADALEKMKIGKVSGFTSQEVTNRITTLRNQPPCLLNLI